MKAKIIRGISLVALAHSSLWSPMGLAGSGTSNGGHGYEINNKIYSYDLTVNGIQFSPYDSLDFAEELSLLHQEHINESLVSLLAAQDLNNEGQNEAVIKDPAKFKTIIFHKLAQLKQLVVQKELPLDIDHMVYHIAAYRWRYLSISCPIVIDARDPKDLPESKEGKDIKEGKDDEESKDDLLLSTRYRDFFPKKIQIAFREVREVSFCKSFNDMNDIYQQVAVVMHEMVYAYIDRYYKFSDDKNNTYEMRKHVYALIGLFFDRQLASPTASYVRSLADELNALEKNRVEASITNRVDHIVDISESVLSAIVPQKDAKLCRNQSQFWTANQNASCDSVQAAQHYRLCSGTRRDSTGLRVHIWITRFSEECQLHSFPYRMLGSYSVVDGTIASGTKWIGRLSKDTLVEFCTEEYEGSCDIEYTGEKSENLDELIEFRNYVDHRTVQVDKLVNLSVNVEKKLAQIVPPTIRFCVGNSKDQIIMWSTRNDRKCRVGKFQTTRDNVLYLTVNATHELKGQLLLKTNRNHMVSRSERTIFTRYDLTPRKTPQDSYRTKKVLAFYDYIGFYNEQTNQLQALCDGDWTGLCELKIFSQEMKLETLPVPNMSIFNAAEAVDSSDFARLATLRVRYLIEEKGQDPNIQDARGNTLLMHAVNKKNYRTNDSYLPDVNLVRYLVEEVGVDVNKVNQKGLTALDYAESYHKEAAEIITNNGGIAGTSSRAMTLLQHVFNSGDNGLTYFMFDVYD